MKKFVCLTLAVIMTLGLFAGCGSTKPQETTASTTAPAASVEGTMEELLNQIVEKNPVEFSGAVTVLDLTDTSENGLWALKSYIGLDSAEAIIDAAAFEPMIGSIAFSMVAVRVAEGQDTKTVAESMKAGVDPRKWICVEADDMLVAGYADVVLLVMVSSANEMTAQSYVDAFQSVVGGEADFVLS